MSGFTVSGPDLERPAPSLAVGVSVALTYANRRARAREEASYYVRDAAGDVRARVDALPDGTVRAYVGDALDRASRDDPAVLPPEASRRRGVPRRSAGNPPAAETKEAPMPRKKEESERGVDLLATLMQLVEERVDGRVERTPNKSGTYTRLRVGGKTFAYVYPPRATGLAVKIPKQLLSVEESLPKGHGFARTGWGLTRTIRRASEAPKAAQALAVAADAVREKEPAAA